MARSSRNFAARTWQFTLNSLAFTPIRSACLRSLRSMAIQWVTFSAETLAAAPALEPSLESFLRSHNVHENVFTACRCQDVLTRSAFINLDSTEEGLKQTAKEAFGIDVNVPENSFPHKREMSKLISAWKEGRLQQDTKEKVDAVSRAHGEPVSRLPGDWEAVEAFQKKYGRDIPEDRLPSQSYFESFEEKLNGNRLKPETLSQVVSQEEEEEQEAKKPDHARHSGVTLDAKVHVQTRRKCTSTNACIYGWWRRCASLVGSSFQTSHPTPSRSFLKLPVQERTSGQVDHGTSVDRMLGIRVPAPQRSLPSHTRGRTRDRSGAQHCSRRPAAPDGTLGDQFHSCKCQSSTRRNVKQETRAVTIFSRQQEGFSLH